MYIEALATPSRLQQLIKNICHISVFADFLKSSCSLSMVNVQFTLEISMSLVLIPLAIFPEPQEKN
jgi:ABC-type uncharacterized transport system permease subunit